MKIDPNQSVAYQAEMVLCREGGVRLHDDRFTPLDQLAQPDSAFHQWCSQLDPNRCFINAMIPDDADRPVFFRAREVASKAKIHMQAQVDTPENLLTLWQNFRQMKATPNAAEKEAGSE